MANSKKPSPKKKAEKGGNNKYNRKLMLALWGIGMAVWVGVALFAMQFILSFILGLILPKEALTSNITNAAYQVVVYALSLVVVIFVPWKLLKMKTTREELGLRGLPTWTDLLLAPIGLIVTLLVSAALTALMMLIIPGDEIWRQEQVVGYSNLYQFSDFLMAFVCLVILAPFCEEVLFRGWLYGKLRFKMPAVPAILIVSLLFGVMHGQLNVGVTVFAMSIGMCVMRELTGTIWGGVLLHMLKNALAFYFLFVVGVR